MKPLRLSPRLGLADVAILCLVGGVIATVGTFAREFEAPFAQAVRIDLRPAALPRYTLYSARRNNVDFRVAKIFQLRRTRTQVGLDLYNVLNADYVTTVNNTFVPNAAGWLTPLSVATARFAKINVQFDF
jgi:hypothetical protein